MVRRRKAMTAILVMLMGVGLTACGSRDNSGVESTNHTKVQEETKYSLEDTSVSGSMDAGTNLDGTAASPNEEDDKVLVVYFSWSGHLDRMAHWIADETGGDLYRVAAKDPYPAEYHETADRAKMEQDNHERPEIEIDLTDEQMKEYDTVFFGFPVWWYDLPMPMWTFLETYDFSGKTIVPFFSHEGSANGAGALPTVEQLTQGAVVRSEEALSIRGGDVDSSESDVRAWVQNLEF